MEVAACRTMTIEVQIVFSRQKRLTANQIGSARNP